MLNETSFLTAALDSETKLEAILNTITDGVIAIEKNGHIQLFNPAAEKLFGYRREEILGQNVSILMPAPDHVAHDGYIANYVQTGIKKIIGIGREVTGKRKDGTVFPLYLSIGDALLNQERMFVAVVHDLTRQKLDKEALQASEERFRDVAEMTGEWLWEQDTEGCYLYSSSAVSQILGYQPEEILGKSYLSLLTEEDKQHWATKLPPTHDVREPFHRLVNRYRHKDGHEVFTESTGKPFIGQDGQLLKWLGVDHDITVRKRYLDALHLRDRAIEAVSVGINITDASDKKNPTIYLNPALSRITGYTKEELQGKDMEILQGPDTDKTVIGEISRALREGRGCEVVLKNYRKDGTPFWNELLISPVHNEAGKLTHFIGVQSDVTERRRAQEERHELEIAKQIQSSLLPKAPLKVDGFQVAGVCLPATHVGGDYYDYYYSQDTLNIVIADVSGHSVGAALLMAGVRNTLKAESRKTDPLAPDRGSAEILHVLNELLHDDLNGSDMFISMFYMRYHPALRQVCYSNAGHNCPLWLAADGNQCRELDAEGMVIGVRKDVFFEEKCIPLQAGDKILLYTDGITEAQNRAGEFFGVDRLSELFAAQRCESPQASIDNILAALRKFCGGQPFSDDVSLVVLNVGFQE